MSLVRLPKLILETPSKTIPRFLESCKPLLSAQQFQATESIANIFLKSTSSVLQERLLQLNNSETSWLENIWLEKNYLSTRSPLPVNCNFWVCFNDHPKHDRLIVKKTPPPGVYTDFQVSRAACIVSNLLDFKDMIHQLPQDYQNDSPLCMSQYNSIFGSSRVPGVEIDTITKNPNSNHIIILLKNQIYKLDTLSSDGSRVPLKELERQIYAACRDSLSSQSEPPINFFTAGERLEWAKAYQLLSRDDLNQSNLKDIQDSAFILCLDDHAQTQKSDKTHRQYFHNENGSNRWFDKPLSIIVASNGRAGANCEHSLIDASVVSNILDYCIEREPAIDSESSNQKAVLSPPEKLTWKVDPEILPMITESRKTVKNLIKSSNSVIYNFSIYGSRFIKQVASTSPDGFIQLMLQLVWHRLHDSPTAVYESVSTRKFSHSRTETCRSLTNESWRFVKSFDDDDILYDTKRENFRKAIAKHTELITDASNGLGIDRHLLGLEAMATTKEEKDSLFKDLGYLKTSQFKMTTSNISPASNYYGGFGAPLNGYGIAYWIKKDTIGFSISGNGRDVYEFRRCLERTLTDVMILFPKRSSVWGMDWKRKHEDEAIAERNLKQMKVASDLYLERRNSLIEKYRK